MAANGEKQQGHRPGVYKQKNKGHKHGKHRTKGDLERDNKGRVSVTVISKKQRREQRKMDRRHNANQLRRNKKDMVLAEKRRLGSKDGPPHLVVVVTLHAQVSANAVTKLLREEGAGGIVHQERFISGVPDSFGLMLPRFKQRFIVMNQSTADLHSLLDIAKVADSLVFVLDPTEGWDSYGDYCLSCLFAQGLPSHALLSQIDAPADPLPMNISALRVAKPGKDVDMIDGGAEEPTRVLMRADPSRRESLQAEAEVDPMDGEQTWPTEAELLEAEESRKNKRVMKVPKGTSDYQAAWIVDEENEDVDGESSEEDDDDDDMMDEAMEGDEDLHSQEPTSSCVSEDDDAEEEEEEVVCTPERAGADQRYDANIDKAAEEEGLQRYREARANEMFPDEVDTPRDTSARNRFQRYRGLKSFRASPWDPMENLPPDYSRIFQFQSFERTRRRILTEAAAEDEGAMVGWYVTLHVMDVPSSVMDNVQAGRPLVLVSLLPHEQKMSVMHLLVRRHPSNTEPIKSKEELIFHCGFRRFRASPIFSQHTSADKHKMERFLRPDAPTVVSVYAPITFNPAGVLLFKQRDDGAQDLVATGSLLSCDPQRIVLKRIVISGHPFKINRRSAVVRYMFFNRDDIMWFKPVELRTKWGRRGHIKEALGTHGHMKCVFDNQLPSQDTVLMNLYKRVYPRWTFDPFVVRPSPWVKREVTVDMHDFEDME
uniref:Pre-rRNA-processing protein TSR1 homolog n=1 Tax=Knipowitschia caucasica TaxID=637954 RepID=A0AAV2J1V5_KNICA